LVVSIILSPGENWADFAWHSHLPYHTSKGRILDLVGICGDVICGEIGNNRCFFHIYYYYFDAWKDKQQGILSAYLCRHQNHWWTKPELNSRKCWVLQQKQQWIAH
jgi:hypothetical protein